MRVRSWALLVLSLASFACPKMEPVLCETGDEETCDAGTLPPDECNSQEEASQPPCVLTLGTAKEAYLSTLSDGGWDRDFYSVTLPGDVDALSLLTVRAGYSVPQTPVNFALNLIGPGGMSLKQAVDKRMGAGQPTLVNFTLPYTQPNAQLLLVVSDEGGTVTPRVDNRSPYTVLVSVGRNPDTNEPNDTMPTNVPLTDMGGIRRSAMAPNAPFGYLATANDVDQFRFEVTGTQRQLIYLRITGPQLTPPPPFQLAYVLKDPMGVPIAEGNVSAQDVFAPLDLSTARLARGAGFHTLEIRGYRSNQMPDAVIEGDIRLRYELDVRVMPDVDMLEPNDSQTQARPVSLSAGQSEALTGRIATVPDEEWFVVRLSPSTQPGVLRYSVRPGTNGGRYPALAAVAQRQLRVMKVVSQGTVAESRQACINNASVCPKYYDDSDDAKPLVETVCNLPTPLCLWAERNEAPRFDALKNLEGALPVAPHTSTEEFLVLYSDPGKGLLKWADDRDYTIRFSYETDTDEAMRGTAPVPVTLGSSAATVSGQLTYGHGRLLNDFNLNTGRGIRGPTDYDAVPTDVDQFVVSYPAGGTAVSWDLEWELDAADGGVPGEVAIDLNVCSSTAATPDGGCAGRRLTLGYTSDERAPWYAQTFQNATMLYEVTRSPMMHRFRLLPVACPCFSETNVAAGRFFLSLAAVNRLSHSPISYRLRQTSGTYPQNYTGGRDGGSGVCPVIPDGGCGFVPR